MSKLLNVFSYKSIENGQLDTYQNKKEHKIQNHFTASNDRKNYSSQNSFHFNQTAKQQKSQQQEDFCKRMGHSNHFVLSSPQNRKPLNEILKSKQTNTLRSLSKYYKEKCKQSLYKTEKKRTNLKNDRVQAGSSVFDSQNKDKRHTDYNCFEYGRTISNDPALSCMSDSLKDLRQLHSEKRRQHQQKSRSSKKKGLQCTLYQRSLEKRINQTDMKSNGKLITVKNRYEKTQNLGINTWTPQKNLKKILLKKKANQNSSLNNTNCFQNLTLERSKNKSKCRDQNANKAAQAFLKLKTSLSLVKYPIKDRGEEGFGSKSKTHYKNTQKRSFSPYIFQLSNFPHVKLPQTCKKVALNDRIQSNLDRIHQKYKFILNYLSNSEIIGKLNGFQLQGQQQCKWILLIIDGVYDMIKHSEKTKLKGMEHSRNYQFITEDKDENTNLQKRCKTFANQTTLDF